MHLVPFNWNCCSTLGVPQSCHWHELGHGSNVKLVKETNCLTLEITLNYLWPLIQQVIIFLLQNVLLAYPIFLEHTQGNFTSLGWCGQCMHACRVGGLCWFMSFLAGYREPLLNCFYTLPLSDHTIVKLLL